MSCVMLLRWGMGGGREGFDLRVYVWAVGMEGIGKKRTNQNLRQLSILYIYVKNMSIYRNSLMSCLNNTPSPFQVRTPVGDDDNGT